MGPLMDWRLGLVKLYEEELESHEAENEDLKTYTSCKARPIASKYAEDGEQVKPLLISRELQ